MKGEGRESKDKRQVMGVIERGRVTCGESDGGSGFWCMVMESNVSGFIRDFWSYGRGISFRKRNRVKVEGGV